MRTTLRVRAAQSSDSLNRATMGKLPSPDLGHCVEILQSISRDTPKGSPKCIGELYVAAVGLLSLLKVDQSRLRRQR